MFHSKYDCKQWAELYEDRVSSLGEEDGQADFNANFRETCRENRVNFEQASLRDLFEAFVPDGRELLETFNPRSRRSGGVILHEAGSAVKTAAFSNIIGQISYNAVLDAYEDPEYLYPELATTEQATTQQEEIVPGIGMLGDSAEDIGETEEYPVVGLTEEWITVPKKVKDGFIVPLSKEAIWEDKTGLLLDRARGGARSMAITREKEAIDNATGITSTYRRLSGPIQATYGSSHTQGDFANLKTSNGLANETNIEAAEALWDEITDPNTGEPVMIGGAMQVLIPTALRKTYKRILGATHVEFGTRSATTPVATSPTAFDLDKWRTYGQPLCNAYVKSRTGSATTWFLGDFKGAFGYSEVWPLTVEEMAPNSHASFTRDIVSAFKVSRKGVYYCKEPRKVIKCTA